MKGRILITGGAGFIGSHLADRLIADGAAVTVLDDFSSGSLQNLSEAQADGRFRLVTGSVLDKDAIDDALQDCGRVFHLAVQCVRKSVGAPIQNHEINATGTITMLEAARRHGIERFIYCSSSEVYGNSKALIMNEETTQCMPVTVYGAAKLAGEYYAKAYWQTYGVPTIVVRPFNSYGPREHERGDLAEVIPRFLIRILNGLPPVIFGTGEFSRDFIYVKETAAGLARAADCDALVGRSVNIALGKAITINRVAEVVAHLCGRPDLVPVHIEPRPGDVHALHADTELAEKMFDFRAEVDFEQGMQLYLDWFRTHHNDLSDMLDDRLQNWDMPATGA